MVDSVISALRAFIPGDDDSETVARLYALLEGFGSRPERERAAPAIFDLMERFPDADFGSPGPLIHELEAITGYQDLLRESLRRRPVPHSIWMVNRILNSPLAGAERASWLDELRSAQDHALASEATRERARAYLDYQHSRGALAR